MIGYLPEESYIYNYLSPRETLDFYGRLFNLERHTRLERVEQLLEMVGLSHAAHRRVGEFSKGMARRTGLAQALINNPELVILDEPTSGLDPIACRQVKDLLLELSSGGKTIILSSHLLADVEDVCDRIAILFNGTIRAEGRVRDLLQKQEITRFSIPDLPPEMTKEVVTAMKERLGKEPSVDHPAVTLEKYFVDVIEKAHGNGEAASRSKMMQTPGVAPFLRRPGGKREGDRTPAA
jgi:ABC-2 type transport system ATP-binding protein